MTVRIGFRLAEELHAELLEAAAEAERTPSSLLRLWTREKLEQRKKRAAGPYPVSPGQLAALHGKAGELDRLRKQARGTSKAAALKATGAQFGKSFESASELSFDECHWLLDYLEDQITLENAQT